MCSTAAAHFTLLLTSKMIYSFRFYSLPPFRLFGVAKCVCCSIRPTTTPYIFDKTKKTTPPPANQSQELRQVLMEKEKNSGSSFLSASNRQCFISEIIFSTSSASCQLAATANEISLDGKQTHVASCLDAKQEVGLVCKRRLVSFQMFAMSLQGPHGEKTQEINPKCF